MDPILEKYIQIIEDYKEGDVTPDGESTLEIDSDGNKFWLNKQGQYHRRDGPAVEYATGVKSWWINGKRHREDGPAVEFDNGNKWWYINNKLHREDGPAVVWVDGSREWWVNNKRHRLDGPAVEWADGDKSWWINGYPLSEDEFYGYIVNKAIKRKKK